METTRLDDEQLQSITGAIVNVVPAKEIYLFGSYAYGEPNGDSDIDLYVVIDDGYNQDIKKAAYEIRRKLRYVTNRPLDVIAKKQADYQMRKNIYMLEKEVSKKGIKLNG